MSGHAKSRKVVVVLPAYHAVKTLKQTIEAIPRDAVDDIILVDDASGDGTAELARTLGLKTIVHSKNRGYGGNQKTCYANALELGADIVVMVHPDFQYDPYYIPDLVRPISEGRADAVFGSRMMIPGGAREGGMPLWKYVANITLSALGNIILGLRLSEYHSGLRAYSRSVLERSPIQLNSDNFIFDTEMIVQLRAFDFRILEMPITTRYFPEASMIGFWKSCEYGLAFLLVLFEYWMHKTKLWRQSKFAPVLLESVKCPGCGVGGKAQELYPTRHTNESRYLITDTRFAHGRIVGCLDCRLVYEERATLIRTDYSNQPIDREYLREEFGRKKAYRRVLDEIKKSRANEGGKLLDIGSGPGFFVAEALGRGYEAKGLETGKDWINFARGLFNLVRVREGDLETFAEEEDGTFDVITAFDFIEHIIDPIAFLHMASRKLKKGGELVLTTPEWGAFVQRVMGEHWHALIPGHLTYFSRKVIERYLVQAGFEIRLARSYRRYFSLQYLLNRLLKTQGETFLRKIVVPVNLLDELEVHCIKR